jgi:formamidase
MSSLFGIAGVQMSVVPWDVPATVERMEAAVDQVSEHFPWVQMIMFHELAASAVASFVRPSSPKPWLESGESIPGPLATRFCELARRTKKWIIPGSMYEMDGPNVYNTALAITPEGAIIAKYRKMFPWLPYENETTAGEQFCVFDVPGVGRFGLCICYDSWFPEVARTLAWMGAEVILHPTLTPTSDRTLELTLNQANAIFNQCYFVDINGLGPWGGGRSLIVDPEGRVLQQAGEHDMIMTEILDLEQVRRVREFGTLGLCQTWKQLRDFRGRFPLYDKEIANGEIFRDLGELDYQSKLELK